ncbi:hypothetical protein [Chondromyces crocatus]|uniref:Uncharacterized protein n=1 Tax=Chondromyces crocatus TaxID=52 RepID=A0A0K1EKS4_CHOCO|nr:hypothetical protein [Chondromyces crocatus]AKT41262.1 uncharacterized protein CMC5_054290 [Chondromyces crocatus]
MRSRTTQRDIPALLIATAVACIAACSGSEPQDPIPSSDSPESPARETVEERKILIVLEQGATLPVRSQYLPVHDREHVEEWVHLRLEGDLHFRGSLREVDAPWSADHTVRVPEIEAGPSVGEGLLVFEVPGAASTRVMIAVVPTDSIGEIESVLAQQDALEKSGDRFAVVRTEALSRFGTMNPGATEEGTMKTKSLCACPFLENIGKLTYDGSCIGRHAAWVIPENGSYPFTPAKAGITYEADGFKVGTQIYKVDGSTCNRILCSSSTWRFESCVNIFGMFWQTKPPYPVPNGTFPREPPLGFPAMFVQ